MPFVPALPRFSARRLPLATLAVLSLWLLTAAVPARAVTRQTIAQAAVAGRYSYQYLLYLPPTFYQATTAQWPLMLMLHGAGEVGTNIEAVAVHGPPMLIEQGRDFPAVVVSPQAPFSYWDPVALGAFVEDLVKKYQIDPDRIYITGLSMGGNGTWMLATTYPDKFAAIVPVCGWGLPSLAGTLRDLPVWAFHGALDTTVPILNSQVMIDGIRAAGGHPLFTIYPTAGHDAWTATYANNDVYTWMFAQTRALPVAAPSITNQPPGQPLTAGSTAVLSVTVPSGSGVNYQWRKDGVDLPGATGATLSIDNLQPANVGFYSVLSSRAERTATTAPTPLALNFTGQIAGSATAARTNIRHPNGNVYDQVLLTGASASVKADPGKIVRVSYLDLTEDIVQVEFTGAGILTINLENASGPAVPVKYVQPDVAYMRGHATIAITGADGSTSLSIFSVGRITAVDQTLFRDGITYDGWADLALVTVASADGYFGGLRTANAHYFRTKGMTGIYAPGVQFGGPVFIGDIDAADSASAVLVLGSVADVRITGGDLLQDNDRAVEVSGIARLQFTGGTSSQGATVSAQRNRAKLVSNGTDVTAQLAPPN